MTTRLIEIDTLMTDISRVMDVPDFKLTELLNEAVLTSDELSSKLTDVLKIAGEFARMGDFSNSELMDMTSTAQVLQNISDLDAQSSVDTLTSAMLNFNIAAEDSIQIADKLNEVDNNFAISTKDLSDGIRKAASTAKTFGVDINELTGYIAAIGSTTRESGAIVGNGLKTIISRITTMDDAAGALNSVNISIKDMAGNVRPVSDILEELSGKWTSLSDEQRQNLGVTLAGRYQLSRFLALMNNFSIAQDATSTAINSTGSSMAEQAKYADSLEARINRLDTAWSNFSLSAGEAVLTDGLIASVETLNDLLRVSSLVVEKVGVLSGVFGTLGIAIFALSSKFRIFATALAITPASMTATSLATVGLTTNMSRATVATIGLTTAFRGLLAATLVGAAFAVVGIAIEKLIGAYSNAKQEQEEFEQSQQKNIDAMTSNKAQTEELIAKYKELSAQRENGGLDTEKEKEYLKLMTQISQTYPALIGHIDATGQAHLKTSEQIDKEIELTNKLIEAKKEEIKVKAQDTIQDQLNEQKKLQDEIKETKKQIGQWQGYDPLFDKERGNESKEIEIKELETKLAGLEIQVSNASLKINDEVLKVAEAFNKLEINPSIQKDITSLISSMDLSKLNSSELESYSQKLATLTDNMQKAFESGDSSGFNEAKNDIADLAKVMGATDVQLSDFAISYDKAKTATEQMTGATDEATDSLDGLGNEVDELAEKFDNSVSNIKSLNGIINELNEGHKLSGDSISTLLEKYPQLLPYLNDEETLRRKIIDAIDEEEKVAKQAMVAKLSTNEQFFKQVYNANKKYFDDLAKMYGIDLKNAKTLAEAKARVESTLLQKLSEGWSKYYNAQSNSFTKQGEELLAHGGEMGSILIQEISKAKHESNQIAQEFDDLAIEFSGINLATEGLDDFTVAQERAAKATEKANKEMERSIYISDKYKLTLEELNTELNELNSLKNDYPQHSKEYRKALEREIELLEEQQSIYDAQSKDLDKQIKSGNVVQYGIQTVSSGTGYTSSSSGSTYTGKYDSQINQAASKYGVDPFLIAAIIQAESNFDPTAGSGKGARGLMQLMPATAKSLGVTNILDPYQNIMAGTKYFVEQLEKFGGDVTLALAAYNAGPGNVNKYGGVPPFKETQDYINRVLDNLDKMAGSIIKSVDATSKAVADYYLNNFKVTSEFGDQESFRKSPHKGIDFANGKEGDPVKALRGGKVITAAYSKSAGYWVVVQQDDGTVAKYMHMQKGLDVKQGQTITAGQKLGEVGNTGHSTGAHLHLQIEQDGTAIDPMSYINGLSSTSSSDASKLEAERLQSIDQAKSELLSIQGESASIADRIQELYMEIVNSQLAAFDKAQEAFNDDLSYLDLQQTRLNKNSKVWYEKQLEREDILRQQIEIEKQSIKYIQEQIKYNNDLSAAQKSLLNDEVISRTQDLRSLEMDILNERIEMADQIIDTYKQALEAQKKAQLDAIDKIIEEIDKSASDSEYKKKLEDAQKDRQEILDEIANLSLDDSASAQKRISELNEQLEDSDDSIYDMQNQNSIDTRKENLETQREGIEDKYENLLNDERKFGEMRSSIINGNTQQIIKDLKMYGKEIKANSAILGKSISNNIIDLINQANYYLNGEDYKPIKIASMDSGGYTGSFGSNKGKYLLAHEKEIILNKSDTSNFLKAIDITRNLVSKLKMPDLSILKTNPSPSTGGNTFSLNLNIDNMNGTKAEAQSFASELVKGLKTLGVDI